jgi:monoamine oxidase
MLSFGRADTSFASPPGSNASELQMRGVLIVGAGVSGLSCAIRLAQAGLPVTILEARDRVGGRVFTDHSTNWPIELGAEFIHGRAPEIWQPLQENRLELTEFDGDNWCFRNNKLGPCDFFAEVDKILQKMKTTPRDHSFVRFLKINFPNPSKNPRLEDAKFWALRYVSGFNAADPAQVSVNWLIQEKLAEEKIDGERAFSLNDGYSALIKILLRRLDRLHVPIHRNTVVQQIRWKQGEVRITGRTKNKDFAFAGTRALITVPLGVLQASSTKRGAITFNPKLPLGKRAALQKLEMGHVLRITLEFQDRFWKDIRPAADNRNTLSHLSFLFSDDEWFPTWWTKFPAKSPMITGWAPFKSADALAGHGRKFVINKALSALSRALGTPRQRIQGLLVSAHFHDWRQDPFCRGAYSYVKTGGIHAPEELAKPIAQTLFFAGEATDSAGQTGTVHGAIATGQRAAKEIEASLRKIRPLRSKEQVVPRH